MELTISYGVVFGKCDGSDVMEYDTVELSDEESMAAMEYALTEDYDEILELEELKETYETLRGEIEESEIENLLESEDEYTMQCQGTASMDADELNDLVHDRDEHALEYFCLEDADDDEIDEWDAYELEEIPTIEEFDPDFEPYSPFDEGLELNLFVTEVCITEEEFAEYLRGLFSNQEFDKINGIVDNCTYDFDRNVEEIIAEVAEEMGCPEFRA